MKFVCSENGYYYTYFTTPNLIVPCLSNQIFNFVTEKDVLKENLEK
jgi:hypothetical protein